MLVQATFKGETQSKEDTINLRSFNVLQKCTSTLHSLDGYLNMSERTSRETLENFCYGVVQMYKSEYLRLPTSINIQLLYEAHEAKHGFPRMLGRIDCTHCNLRNCPMELRCQYMRGLHQYPKMILEVVTSQDLWFLHAFYRVADSNNDLNVVKQSPIIGPNCSFYLNDEHYKDDYYLADEIYPTWAVFVKAYPYLVIEKKNGSRRHKNQQARTYNVLLGVLKGRWDILKMSEQSLTAKKNKKVIMYVCIILDNMILMYEVWFLVKCYF
uniref:DDE Tnp4 domain-containing protein n=1 Tax=Lactuca sativa TaxID=4236 RepID=A0A9R1W6X4_LACSA|nr:hypothetical protein LSAT_V11C200063800 [Lactuca sativa]